jgi:hypothetical protein
MLKNIYIPVIFGIISFAFSSFVHSGEYAEGVYSTELKYKCKNDRPKKQKTYDAALKSAKTLALRNWASKQSIAMSNLFSQNEGEILQNLDQYLLNTEIMNSCEKKSFRLLVVGTVDVNRIGLLGKSQSMNASGKRSRIMAVFMARKASEVKSFDDKVTKIDSKSKFNEGSETATFSGTSASTEGYSSQKNISQTGGSTVTKSDRIKWTVYRPGGLSSAIQQTFASYKFKVAKPSQLPRKIKRINKSNEEGKYLDPKAFSIEDFKREFSAADGLSPETEGRAQEALEYVEVPLFAIGTMDVGKKNIDPKSGKVMVNVTVSAAVQYNDDGWWETVASVEPQQFSGLGIDEMSAETDALIKAAKAASNEIVQQLNAAGIN